MMFGDDSSSPWGGPPGSNSNSSSSSRLDVDQPLRSRQHARGSASTSTVTTTPTDLLFSHPQSSFDDFPYPPYSELPFTSLKRRKPLNHHQVVRWAMRAVLLSPVIVLVVWSLGAMMFSKNVNQKSNNNNNKSNHRMNSRGVRNNQRMMNGMMMMAPQPNQLYMMPPPQQQLPQQHIMYGAPPQGNQMNQNMVLNPLLFNQEQQMIPQQQQQQQQSGNMIVQPQGLQPPPQQQPMLMSQGQFMDPQVMIVQPSMQQPQVVMQPAYQEPQELQIPQATLDQPPVFQEAPALVTSTEGVVSLEALGSNARNAIHQHAHMRGSAPNGATVLYYDPQQTSAGQNGQVRLPSTVYDALGNPIDLASFAAQNQVQILMESPRQQAQPQDLAPLQQEEPLFEQPPLVEQALPEAQMSAPDIKNWGESTSQDQSIIVGTVAVMAMLVGALSARRLRNRSVLSACIENETLEDDLAYDAAYSTTMPQHNGVGSSSYNTFGGGGWKGDLEKFDV